MIASETVPFVQSLALIYDGPALAWEGREPSEERVGSWVEICKGRSRDPLKIIGQCQPETHPKLPRHCLWLRIQVVIVLTCCFVVLSEDYRSGHPSPGPRVIRRIVPTGILPGPPAISDASGAAIFTCCPTKR